MKYSLLVALALTCLCSQRVWTQDDEDTGEIPNVTSCVNISMDLMTMAIQPQMVPDLPVCTALRSFNQCCSVEYIRDRQAAAAQAFREGLREELRDRFEDVFDLCTDIRDFLETDFINGFFDNLGELPFRNNRANIVGRLAARLRANLEFDPDDDDDDDAESGDGDSTGTSNTGGVRGFRDSDFLEDVLEGITNATITEFGANNIGACIRRVVRENIQARKMEAMAEALEQVRRAFASFNFICRVATNLTNDLAGYEPIPECVDALVRLNTCGRCIARRGPFCRNLCGALARACYSPFNNALTRGLGRLWEVTRRVFDSVTDTIEDLNENSDIVDSGSQELQQQIAQECLGQQPMSRRQARRGVPPPPGRIMGIIARLRGGPFDYEGRRSRGPGLCRLLNVSTSRSMCFNGNDDGDDEDEFIGDAIEDQDTNPVNILLDTPITTDALTASSQGIVDVVSQAIDGPNFAEVAPNGVILPPPIEPEVGGGASSVTAATLLTVAFMMLAGFIL